jgi:hypothetical protein
MADIDNPGQIPEHRLSSIPPFQSGLRESSQIFDELIDIIDEKCRD